jgi:hypothetical protein
MLDEKHDVWSIWNHVPLNNSILNLMDNEILVRVFKVGTLMSKIKQLN